MDGPPLAGGRRGRPRVIVAEAYGGMDVYLRGLLLAYIAVNETLGPILFGRARDGRTGLRQFRCSGAQTVVREKWGWSKGAVAGLLAAQVATFGCAATAAGTPAESRFTSNRGPAEAYACATEILRLRGFDILEASTEPLAAVMLRRPPTTADGTGEWWRVEVSVSAGDDAPAVVRSVAGASSRRDGPYGAPPVDLLHLVGVMSYRCTWGSAS